MKTLHLLRHAKSSWRDPGRDDHDRSLAARGERAARAMGALLARAGVRPDLVLCSSSLRARQTLDRILPDLDTAPQVKTEPELYLAGAADLLIRIQAVDPAVGELLVVGHNPGLAELAKELAGAGDRKARALLARKFPTAAWAALRFPVKSWNAVRLGGGELIRFVRPKDVG